MKFIAILFFLYFGTAFGQKLDKKCVIDYSKSFVVDTKNYITAPLKWNKKQLIINTGLGLIGGSLFFADDWVQSKFPIANGNQMVGIKYGFEYFGNGFYSMPLMAGMFIYGLSAKKTLPFRTSLMGVKSFVLSTLVTRVLKYSLNRYRPEEGRGANFFAGPFNPFSLSFPSGHTTGAFAVASVLAKNFSRIKWIPIASYSLATGVGLSRLWTKQHWASDVFFGALVGWSVGTLVSEIDCLSKESSWRVNPMGVAYIF